MRAAVLLMYEKILGDERLAHFFEHTSMQKLRCMYAEFVSIAFGAPHQFSGTSLQAAHAPLVENGLSDYHFDLVKEHMQAAMEELGVQPEHIAEGMEIIEELRKDVLGK